MTAAELLYEERERGGEGEGERERVRVCIQGVPGGKDLTSGESSLGQTIPI